MARLVRASWLRRLLAWAFGRRAKPRELLTPSRSLSESAIIVNEYDATYQRPVPTELPGELERFSQ